MPLDLDLRADLSGKSVWLRHRTSRRPEEERLSPHDTIFRKTHADGW